MAALQLPASVTIEQVGALLPLLDAAAASAVAPAGLQIDASALQDFDTSAVAFLLQARRLAEARGVAFAVVDAPPKLAQLADLYGVAGLLSLSTPLPTSPASPASPPDRSVAT